MATDINEESKKIEEILLTLESNEKLQDRENYRAAVRNHQYYFVPFLSYQNDTQRMFKIPNQFNFDSVPIFLSEVTYLLFESDYLKKHGYLDTVERNQEVLSLKRLTGRELFQIIPKSKLSAFFVMPGNENKLSLSFNLAKVFTHCFYKAETEFDPAGLIDESENEADLQENSNLVFDVKLLAQKEIVFGQKFRKMFGNKELIVWISQPTANKLLKGELSRDDFDLDRYDNKQVVIFTDTDALEKYKKAPGQTQTRFYNVKVDRKRIFGSDLSKYEVIIANPDPPNAVKIYRKDFEKLNQLFASFEVETTLSQIDKRQLKFGQEYLDVKRFQNFILPVDNRLRNPNLPLFSFPVFLGQDDSGNYQIPVFTAKDFFETFRLRVLEGAKPGDISFIEPYFIEGERLFQILSSLKTHKIVFNPNTSMPAIICDSNFALKVYCA